MISSCSGVSVVLDLQTRVDKKKPSETDSVKSQISSKTSCGKTDSTRRQRLVNFRCGVPLFYHCSCYI